MLSKAQQKYLQRHYSCQYLTVDWQLFFCVLVKACWIGALAGRSRQRNWTPLPQSQISADLKGFLWKEYWVSESEARKEKNSFFSSFLVLIATESESDPWTQDSYFYRPHQPGIWQEVVSFCQVFRFLPHQFSERRTKLKMLAVLMFKISKVGKKKKRKPEEIDFVK